MSASLALRTIEFIGDIARKTGPRGLLAVEAEKTRQAALIGERTGLFYVPRIIHSNIDAGWIDFERLHGLVDLRDLLVRGNPVATPLLLERIGRSLAAVHESLTLDEEMKYPFEEKWTASPRDQVFIHGDFTVQNVCFDLIRKRLVIVDWSAAPLVGKIPTFGTRYFDIFWFAFDLFSMPGIGESLRWRPKRFVDAFFHGYVEQSGIELAFPTGRSLQRLFSAKAHEKIARGLSTVSRMEYLPRLLHQYLLYALWRCYRPPTR